MHHVIDQRDAIYSPQNPFTWREVYLRLVCFVMPPRTGADDWLVADSEDEDSFSIEKSLDFDLSKDSGEYLPFPAQVAPAAQCRKRSHFDYALFQLHYSPTALSQWASKSVNLWPGLLRVLALHTSWPLRHRGSPLSLILHRCKPLPLSLPIPIPHTPQPQ